MSTAFVPIVLAPAVHSSKSTSQETTNSYSTHQSINLDTPRSNDESFSAYTSPYPQPGRSTSGDQNGFGQNGYPPTPESASPAHPSRTQQLPMHSHQPYSHSQQFSSPSSKQVDWHTQVAGPSTYRRTQSPQTMSSPMSASEYFDGAMAGGGQARSSSGPGPNRAEQVPIEPVETDGRVGVEDPWGERKYTEMKCLGDGSFGTVWLCDWHSPVKPDLLLSAMQCGAGARPEWAGKRLVALKRMKRVWEGGWKQAKTLGELVSLSKIPPHPAIIPLYDAFISPKSRELYFVFECMEGNLYQLTKSRRGRPLASGLIASCFHQISAGLYHIHGHGYFHRDMKPENLLVTTTGLTDYLTAAALAEINSSRSGMNGQDLNQHSQNSDQPKYEKDVSVIVKLADFGLARATDSKPPYTEYVSTRWYRAPEVLLRSTEYGPPVDMWALGTILAEMLNLKPLFPGVSEIDQVYRICDTMGDPSAEYGADERGRPIGGGSWNSGIKLAKNVGFSFPKRKPVRFRGLFNDSVPQSLVDCISDLLRYNPKYRMTAAQCIDHAYFHETLPHLQRTPPLPRIPFSQGQPAPGAARPAPAEFTAAPRQLPPSHSHTPHDARPAFANGDMRTLPPPVGTPDGSSPSASHRLFFPSQSHLHNTHADSRAYAASASALVHQLRELDLPTDDLASYGNRPPPSPGARRESAYSQTTGIHRSQQWVNDVALNTRRPSNTHSSMYDGSVFEGSQGGLSNPNFGSYSNASLERTPDLYSHPSSHVAAYVQQQQRYAEETPRLAASSQLSLAPSSEPTVDAVRADKLAASGKKKKWGLSSVFGGVGKSTPDLATVDENAYTGTSSLKRTQSGHRPQDRAPSLPLPPPPPPIIDDPKKAKKEAERQAKELAKAQREAMASKQKERARAVMQKRNQLIEVRKGANAKGEIEFSSSGIAMTPDAAPLGSSLNQPPVFTSASSTSLAQGASPSLRDPRSYGGPATQSMASVRSHDSGHSGHSGRSGLSAAALAAYDDVHSTVNRHKARRRDDDDDHSMSSFGHNSLRSRSALTVGTVDSDPGPRRSTRSEWHDPIQRTHDPKRAPSVASFHHQHSLMSRSNASLESQLAHDFKAHANVGAGAGSSTSLGRHGTSQLSLQGHLETLGVPQPAMNGSAPTSPYGHPKGTAVALGAGMGRHGTVLPSISSWEGSGVGEAQINPMFRVPPAGLQAQQGTTLPPFSAIANVAGREGQAQGQNQ